MPDPTRSTGPLKALLATSATLLALSAVLLVLLLRRPAGMVVSQETLDDPRVRDRVVEILAGRVPSSYDSHNDPEVGRVLLKNQHGRTHATFQIDTNRFGLRERDYDLPKKEGTVRVVLLGDSYVFGTGARAEDRFGVHLQRFLRERSGRDDVEVLHVGILSWNAVAEAVYVRRQLSLLQPDLVIQITLSNDLDDVEGVRGFGGIARFTPRHRERGEAAIHSEHPSVRMGLSQSHNPLLDDADGESAERWELARAAITRLATELERCGAKYLHLFRWPGLNAKARALLGRDLTDEQTAFVSTAFTSDQANWVAPDDMHWGPDGMRAIALLCYGLIQQRGLLPMLELPAWDEADREVDRIHGEALRERSQPVDFRPAVDARLDLERLDEAPAEGAHVYGGIDGGGLMGSFASVILATEHGTRLHLRARCLERPEIDGTHLRVSAEGTELGACEIRAGVVLDESWPLPEELRARAYLNVRLEADDWFYQGDDLQECVSVQLLSLAIDP